jgi:hypothetical protein
MAPDRLELARLAYQQALTSARSEATASSWRRLRTSARNLSQVIRERAAAVRNGASMAGGGGARAVPGSAVVLRIFRTPARVGDRWQELADDVGHASALMAQARRLVREAAELCASIDELVASIPVLMQGRPAPRTRSSRR